MIFDYLLLSSIDFNVFNFYYWSLNFIYKIYLNPSDFKTLEKKPSFIEGSISKSCPNILFVAFKYPFEAFDLG